MRGFYQTINFVPVVTIILNLEVILVAANLPPTCQYDQFNSQIKPVGQIRCSCRRVAPSYSLNSPSSYPLSPSYSGNLNFLVEPLSLAKLTQVEVVLKDCHQIQLHLNFKMLKYKINLRILNSNKTEIVGVTLRESSNGVSEKQMIIFKNIKQLVKIGGKVEGQQVAALELKAENVGDISLSGLESDIPLKLTAKHCSSISILNSHIHQLPWPGFFFFNVTKVLITDNYFNSVLPRSVHITNVQHLNISNNMFPNLSQALNVDTVSTKTIQCNTEAVWSTVDPGCDPPSLPTLSSLGHGPTIPRVLVKEDPEPQLLNVSLGGNVSLVPPPPGEATAVLHTILGVSDMYGLVFISVSVLLVLVFLIIYSCSSCRRTNNLLPVEKDMKPVQVPPVPRNPFLEPHLGCEEDDEYSNSSKSHLAQGADSIVDPLRSPFITVNAVRAEKGKGGVVCGSLTLGPSFTVKETNVRSVANNQLKKQTFSKI